jgi:hypothetical protein
MDINACFFIYLSFIIELYDRKDFNYFVIRIIGPNLGYTVLDKTFY